MATFGHFSPKKKKKKTCLIFKAPNFFWSPSDKKFPPKKKET
jgi:hypothetical protein